MKIIILCVLVSAITSVVLNRINSSGHFVADDHYIEELMGIEKNAFIDTVHSIQCNDKNITLDESMCENAVSAAIHALPSESH